MGENPPVTSEPRGADETGAIVSEIVSLEGHLVDSGIMAGVMDEIIDAGASYEILELQLGVRHHDESRARIK
jgi:hypothetical protein